LAGFARQDEQRQGDGAERGGGHGRRKGRAAPDHQDHEDAPAQQQGQPRSHEHQSLPVVSSQGRVVLCNASKSFTRMTNSCEERNVLPIDFVGIFASTLRLRKI